MSVLGGVAGLRRLGAHRGGDHGGPGLTVQPKPAVQLVADAEGVVEVEGDERGRNMPGEPFSGAYDPSPPVPPRGASVMPMDCRNSRSSALSRPTRSLPGV